MRRFRRRELKNSIIFAGTSLAYWQSTINILMFINSHYQLYSMKISGNLFWARNYGFLAVEGDSIRDLDFLSYQFRTVIPSLGVFSEWHFYYNKSIGMQREYSGSFRLRMLVLRDGHSGSMTRCGIRMATLVFSWRVLSCRRMLTLSFTSLNVFVHYSTRFGCFMYLC